MPELEEKQVNYSPTNVTLTTTTETVVVSSGPVKVSRHTCLVHVRAWAQLTTGAATSAVTPRIRRGTANSGQLLSEANAEEIKIIPGSIEPFVIEGIEERSNMDTVEYSLTLQQASATGNGTVLQALIEVEILGG